MTHQLLFEGCRQPLRVKGTEGEERGLSRERSSVLTSLSLQTLSKTVKCLLPRAVLPSCPHEAPGRGSGGCGRNSKTLCALLTPVKGQGGARCPSCFAAGLGLTPLPTSAPCNFCFHPFPFSSQQGE